MLRMNMEIAQDIDKIKSRLKVLEEVGQTLIARGSTFDTSTLQLIEDVKYLLSFVPKECR